MAAATFSESTPSAIGTATPDHLYTAMQAAMDANVDVASTRWMLTPRDDIALHKL